MAVFLLALLSLSGAETLQERIDRASAEGGGLVVVSPGRHLVGQIDLRSNVELHLEKGAVLEGKIGLENYCVTTLPFSEGTWSAIVSAIGATNVAITGEGEIFGNGTAWSHPKGLGGNQEGLRPRGVFFANCTNVRLRDFTLRDSACWGIVFKCCENVDVRRVRVDSHANANNDGMDVEAKNVVIADCDIDSGDDAVCLKSNTPDFAVENVLVTNVVARSHCNALKLGTASHGTMRNVLFVDCRTEAARRGVGNRKRVQKAPGSRLDERSGSSAICVENVDGGIVENVTFRNIVANGSRSPIFVRAGTRSRRSCGTPPSNWRIFRGIRIENVTGTSLSGLASSITGVPGCRVADVTLRNVHLTCRGLGDAARRWIETPVPEVAGSYPEAHMFGHALPAYGLYARHVDGLTVEDCTFALAKGDQDPRKPVIMEDVAEGGREMCAGREWTWITGPDGTSGRALAFRKTLDCRPDLRRAILRHTGLGVYEITVNGGRVGDVELKPGFTSPGVRESHVDDITALLKAGARNVIEVEVADSYWRDLVSGDPKRVGSRPNGFAASLTLAYRDGRSETLATGPDWEAVSAHPLMGAGIYEGEEYVANVPRDGVGTGPARVFHPDVRVLPAKGVVRMRKDLAMAARVPFAVRPGERRVVDFGQNAAGRESFTVNGAAGTRLEIRHAEVLNPDGTCYFGNLRRARATTVYTLAGGGPESFRPLHTYYGFRYVEISSDAPVEFSALSFEPITSVREETGRLVTSDPDVNRIISCAEWAIRSNQTGVPTDCCQRGERLGWMGDACVSVPAACWLWDAREFYLGKVVRDQRDLQHADGRYCSLSPGRAGETGEDKYGIAGWSDAGVLIPYRVCRHFGGFALAAEHYPSMRAYGRWLEERGGPFPGYWGDWLAFQRTGYGEPRYPYGSDPDTHRFLCAAFRVWDFAALAAFADALGKKEDAARFAADGKAARAALHGMCFDEDGRLRREYAAQTTYAMALVLGLCPDAASRAATVADLELNVVRSGRRLMTGVIGTQFILEALSENGKAALAYDLLLRRACPSWLYMVDHGATTTWERWDGILSDGSFNDPKMNSFNHADFACVLDWMYRTMAGIRPNPTTGGFDDFELVPRPDRRIRTVEASYRAPQGMIRVKSEYGADGKWTYRFEVPEGTFATVRLPGREPFRAGPGEHVRVL